MSWFQDHARQSVQLIRQTSVVNDASIIVVGRGASTLVDDLLDEVRRVAAADGLVV